MSIQIKRAYETRATSDGLRVLVDRLWPRGLTKEQAAIDVWAKELAPSAELRTWFAHDDKKFEEFTRRYDRELDGLTNKISRLLTKIGEAPATLVYSARNAKSNHAVVLKFRLRRELELIRKR